MQEQARLLEDQKPVKVKKPDFILSDKHHEMVKTILKNNITKHAKRKGCDRCGLTGIRCITEENLIHPCKCVCKGKARAEWLRYCEDFRELKRKFICK